MKVLGQRRVLAGAVLVAAVAGGVLVAGGPAQAQQVTTGTLTLSGDQGSLTGGKTYSYSTGNGDLLMVSGTNSSTVTISVQAPGSISADWNISIDAPGVPGQPAAGHPVDLVPGTYKDAHRYPFNGMGPGLDVSGDGFGCNEETGSFTITKSVFGPNGYVQNFDATFVQHCEGMTPALRGTVHISNPPAPPPSPSATTRSPYAPPTVAPSAVATGPALAGGGATRTTPSPVVMNAAAQRQFTLIGLLVVAWIILIAVVGLVAYGVVMGRARRALPMIVAPGPRPAGLANAAGAVMEPRSVNDPSEHRWIRHDPAPPVPRQSVPGKVIAVSIVLAVRGGLGLLLSLAIIEAAHLRAAQGHPVAQWYSDVMWLQVAVCAGEVVSGSLLWRGKAWPRVLGLGVLWFDIAAGALIMLATSFSCGGLTGIAVDGVLIWMLSWSDVKYWCY